MKLTDKQGPPVRSALARPRTSNIMNTPYDVCAERRPHEQLRRSNQFRVSIF